MTKIEERPLVEPPGMEAIAKDEAPIYDENGAIEPAFLRDVTSAIEAGDAQKVRMRAGGLHEADLGLLTASLEPELRPKLIEMMGATFDFVALIEMDDNIREEILAELPNETVAEGVRDLESDDVSLFRHRDTAAVGAHNVFELDRTFRAQQRVKKHIAKQPVRRIDNKYSKNDSGRFSSLAARIISIACPAVQNGGVVTKLVCMRRPAECSGYSSERASWTLSAGGSASRISA